MRSGPSEECGSPTTTTPGRPPELQPTTLAARSAKASNETSDLIENTINLVQNGDKIAQSAAASLDEINDSVIFLLNRLS